MREDYLWDLLRLVLSIIDPRVARIPRERHTLAEDGERGTVTVSIHQTTAITDKRGRAPEASIAANVAKGLREKGFGYEIGYGFEETHDPPSESSMDNDVLSWWRDNGPDHRRSNLLIVDARGGGRAYRGGRFAVVGANRIRADLGELSSCGGGGDCRNVRAGMHEVGHNLGGRHTTPMLEDLPAVAYHDNIVPVIEENL